MKYTYLFTFFQLLIFLPLKAETEDPFAAFGTVEWKTESLKEKPYRIEILYGEHKKEFPIGIDSETYREVQHSEFLDASTLLSIITSVSETGELKEDDRYTLEYKISESVDGLFDLDICFLTVDSKLRKRELKTEITLKESYWYIFTGLTRQTVDGSELIYTTAVRVVKRTNQS